MARLGGVNGRWVGAEGCRCCVDGGVDGGAEGGVDGVWVVCEWGVMGAGSAPDGQSSSRGGARGTCVWEVWI